MPALRSQDEVVILKTSRRPKQPPVSEIKKKVKPIPTPNIAAIPEKAVPMTSHLDDAEQNRRKNWPHTAFYENIRNMTCGDMLTPNSKQCINEGNYPKNQIHCKCGPKHDCSTNPNCACYKAAMAMKKAFNHDSLYTTTTPLPFEKTAFDKFYKEPVFQCGDGCACSNRECKLNALRRMDEHKFTIERHDVRKGFCVFTKNQIEKGDAIMSFNGELTGFQGIRPHTDVEQYSIILLDGKPEQRLATVLATKMPMIERKYADLLRKTFAGGKVYINPVKLGNVARFLSHGCKSTIYLARVFQGGFSPVNLRIVLLASKQIAAGNELTFDYGNQYLNAHLPACLCDWCKAKATQKKETRKVKKRPVPREQEQEAEEVEEVAEVVVPPKRPVGRPRKTPIARPVAPVEVEQPIVPRRTRFSVKKEQSTDVDDDVNESTSDGRRLRARSQSVRRDVPVRNIKQEPVDDYEEEDPHRHPTMALRQIPRSRMRSPERTEPIIRTVGAQTRFQTRAHGQPPEELFAPMRRRFRRAMSMMRSEPVQTRLLARLQSLPPNY